MIPTALLLALTACSGSTASAPVPVPHVLTPTSSPSPGGRLLATGIRWYVAHMTTEQGDQSPSFSHSYFFIEDDDSVRGNLGCHDFTGRAQWKAGSTVVLTDFVTEPDEPEGATEPCSQGDKKEEAALTSELTDVELTYVGGGETVTLNRASDGDPYSTASIVIEAAPHSPTLLTDKKRWSIHVVETSYDGNPKTRHGDRTGGKPWIEFGTDGSVEGDTGCSKFKGTWAYGKPYNTVKLSGVRRDGSACDAEPTSAMGRFDSGFYKLLDGVFSWNYKEDIRALSLGGIRGTLSLRHKK